jgi:hypothetical protein
VVVVVVAFLTVQTVLEAVVELEALGLELGSNLL